jgi:glycosyltransferase involved in cell wall biosynthesis
VAVEKNIRAFLDLELEGTKLVVGDGPELETLISEYPQAQFARAKFGEELALYFAASDVFVFPSRTDTFGLVILEALASGIPGRGLSSHGSQGRDWRFPGRRAVRGSRPGS